MSKNYNIGDTVWFASNKSPDVEPTYLKGIVIKVEGGKVTVREIISGKHYHVGKVYTSKEDIARCGEWKQEDKTCDYKKELNELGDFLLFPIEHSLIEDDDARQAYIERAREVFGVNLV